MPVIEPVPWAEIDPDLRTLIEVGRESRMLSTTIPPQLWAYRPDAAKGQLRLYEELFRRGVLDERLRELVRLRIAAINDCDACKLARKSDNVSEEDVACLSSDDERFTDRERAALRFAELFAVDHAAIDDQMFERLGAHFSNEEIVELGLFVALMLGNGRLTYVLRAYEHDEEAEPVLRYDREGQNR